MWHLYGTAKVGGIIELGITATAFGKTSLKGKGNRAFTKTGLKVVFQFLLKDKFVNMPYREIAA
jgi:hypothetical protein